MACDGEIAPEEIELIKSICKESIALQEFDFETEINKFIVEINADSKQFLSSYFEIIEHEAPILTEQEEAFCMDIAMGVRYVDAFRQHFPEKLDTVKSVGASAYSKAQQPAIANRIRKIIMARYTGPKSRIARKFGEGIFGADKVLSKKNYPPGQHGNSRKRKTSEYGIQLREKQKAKYTYGVLEKQFRNLFEKAETAKGITGEILLQLLEGRLDNVVFRLGIAPSRAAARQLVSHKHITVDGSVVNIPSYAVKPGQVIGVRERSKSLEVIINSLAGFNHSKYPWLEWDDNAKVGKLLHIPERTDIPENIKEHLIVELYSK
jgi:small subunit ribosomal protein S4